MELLDQVCLLSLALASALVARQEHIQQIEFQLWVALACGQGFPTLTERNTGSMARLARKPGVPGGGPDWASWSKNLGGFLKEAGVHAAPNNSKTSDESVTSQLVSQEKLD